MSELTKAETLRFVLFSLGALVVALLILWAIQPVQSCWDNHQTEEQAIVSCTK